MAELTSWGWGIDSNSWMGLSGDKKTHSALVGDKKTHGSLDEHREETNPQEVCFRCKLQKLRFWMNLDLNLTACPLCDLRQISCPPPPIYSVLICKMGTEMYEKEPAYGEGQIMGYTCSSLRQS